MRKKTNSDRCLAPAVSRGCLPAGARAPSVGGKKKSRNKRGIRERKVRDNRQKGESKRKKKQRKHREKSGHAPCARFSWRLLRPL